MIILFFPSWEKKTAAEGLETSPVALFISLFLPSNITPGIQVGRLHFSFFLSLWKTRFLSLYYVFSNEETEGLDVEDARSDPASFLTRELLNIQLNMKSFQQDRKQLR